VRDPEAAGLGGPRAWHEAIAACERLNYAGRSDWRLPNRNELQSLADYSLANPAIDGTFFVSAPAGFWSSTTSAENPAWAWAVYFDDGAVASGDKNYPHHVRPVRTAR
jgi:hypothetical protein